MRFRCLTGRILNAFLVGWVAAGSSAAQSEETTPFTAFDTYRGYESVYPDFVRFLGNYEYDRTANDLKDEELRYFAARLAIHENVPYVWGGGSALSVDPSTCEECKACISEGAVQRKEVYRSCRACQNCGIDCSHLVKQILNQAGMPYRYGSTEELLQASPDELDTLYNLSDVGRQLDDARPGDLLVFRSHVVLLLENLGRGRGSVVHSAAFRPGTEFGGIAMEDHDLKSYAGGVIRILRHRELKEYAERDKNANRRQKYRRAASVVLQNDLFPKSSTGNFETLEKSPTLAH